MLFSGTPETHLKRRLFILSQTKSCNPNCDTYEDKSDNMMIRITFLENTTYFKEENILYPSRDKLKPFVFVVSSFIKTVAAETQTQELVFIVCFTGCYLAPSCGHRMSPQCVSVQCVFDPQGLEVPLVAVLQWSTPKMPFTNCIYTHYR